MLKQPDAAMSGLVSLLLMDDFSSSAAGRWPKNSWSPKAADPFSRHKMNGRESASSKGSSGLTAISPM